MPKIIKVFRPWGIKVLTSNLSSDAKLVALCLDAFCSRHCSDVMIPEDRLLEVTSLPPDRQDKALRELMVHGWIERCRYNTPDVEQSGFSLMIPQGVELAEEIQV